MSRFWKFYIGNFKVTFVIIYINIYLYYFCKSFVRQNKKNPCLIEEVKVP